MLPPQKNEKAGSRFITFLAVLRNGMLFKSPAPVYILPRGRSPKQQQKKPSFTVPLTLRP